LVTTATAQEEDLFKIQKNENLVNGSQRSRRGCPHYAFGALKVTTLGKQILLNS